MRKEIILILDFGSPYTQLIAQRIRENHVFSRIVPYNISAKEIELQKPKGIILSGGPLSTSAYKKKKKTPPLPEKGIFKLNIPILGICYGAKVIVQFFGGRVKSAKSPELERCELFIDDSHNLFWQMPGNITCWMNHSDCIKKLPAGFKKIAHTQDNPVVAFKCLRKKVFGVGFHPEVVATQRGSQILSNFLYKISGYIGTWTMDSFIRDTVENIRKTVGKSKVLLNLTGDLNHSVVALLVNKAIGRRLKCVFIDNGLLRLNETKQIKKVLGGSRTFHLNISYMDRSQRFLQSLKGVIDPDEKKKITHNIMIKLFEEEAKKSKGIQYLAQGVFYSDVIKSSFSDVSGGKLLKLKLLQPLRDLFIDEIRVVAKGLGLPDNMIFRQPFPEAGLATRIVGEVTTSRLKILREADVCLIEEIKSAGIYEQIWQAFAILIPSKNVIAIRCVASMNGMTADWMRLPYDLLEKIARHIASKVRGVSRVVYDISSKPPATIEWE